MDEKGRFKSYINESSLNNGDKNGAIQELKPKLLNGELVVGEAHSVVMLAPLSDLDRGKFGSLFVTNYKLSFVPLDNTSTDEHSQHNSLLGAFDVALTCVSAIWLTDGGPRRRRRLLPNGEMPRKVKGLQVICKNMKVLTFSFANSALDNGRKLAMALLHYAFPKRHDLLFAFEYREPYYPTLPPEMNMFHRPEDWKRELERCNCPHWRITCINGTSDAFMLSAGETLIVPNSVLDYNLMEAARHFRSGRVPIWVWGRPEGAALLRCGELLQTEQAATTESVYLEQVRRCHPKLWAPQVWRASSGPRPLPPLPELAAAHLKLTDLCTPPTIAAFWSQDSQYYSLLESSRWLRLVATCIAVADEAAEMLQKNVTVVLQEGDGVDYSAVVSCLTQLLVDPHTRTINGFQSLIQKEFIALGHPFCDRFGLPRPGVNTKDPPTKDSAPQPAPIFLLLLDCVWQIINQFPQLFQFTETYLTTLWDVAHNHVFTTFLFNCPRDRDYALSKNFTQRPIWDWAEQFSDRDMALFYNPLYKHKASSPTNNRLSTISTLAPAFPRLEPCTSVAGMELWSQCYERWLPPLNVPQCHVQMHHLIEAPSSTVSSRHSNGHNIELTKPPVVSRFYPFSTNKEDMLSTTLDSMQLSLIDATQLLDTQSLLNAPD